MNQNKGAYRDPPLFTIPPPNFKMAPPNWNNFNAHRTPAPRSVMNNTSPPTIKYNHELPRNLSQNYKNTAPPKFSPQRSHSGSELSISAGRNYENCNGAFHRANVVQSFKPDVPPPPFHKNTSHSTNSSPSASVSALQHNTVEDASNQYVTYSYRPQDSTNTLKYPLNLPDIHTTPPKYYSLPPPTTHIPPPQPPLPPMPPPLNPPPPPPLPVAITVQNHVTNYHSSMSPYALYGHNYPNVQNTYKRKFEVNDHYKKLQKKRKKPLSQTNPQRRDWTMEEAKKALEVEKECNKRSKRQGLIIKFPDLELNRDIVSSFHTSIESVHFQQPCTARYCFITLEESADPETVINQLNQIPFGLGYLSAEFKNNKEEEQNFKPSDIDPLTLYVGNLSQEITKDDMIKTYPKQKRIDIGYAKKMKFTRYAFVSFYKVDDAIEAFQKTHSSQMYSKSLIVRFRRLNGTIGMSGEPKQQMSQQTETEFKSDENGTILIQDNESDNKEHNPWEIDISNWENDNEELKHERCKSPTSEEDEVEEVDVKSSFINYISRFRPGSAEVVFSLHKPKPLLVKTEKEDESIENNQNDENHLEQNHSLVSNPEVHIPTEISNSVTENEGEIQSVITNIKQEKDCVSAPSNLSYKHLLSLNRQIQSKRLANCLNKSNVAVKNEDDNGNEDSNKSSNFNIVNVQSSVVLGNNPTISNENTTCNSSVPENNNSIVQNEEDILSSSRKETEKGSYEKVNDENDTSICCVNMDCSAEIKTEILEEEAAAETLDRESTPTFNWMNMDSTTVVKIENEDDKVHDGDDDSSGDELSMENILNRARSRYKKNI